jgi:hypothetical protein
MWTVVSVDGGATTPVIQSATQAIATVVSPNSGSYSISLTVMDNVGATDVAIVTVNAMASGGDTGSTSPPPATGNSGGGGSSPGLLMLFALLLLARRASDWRART